MEELDIERRENKGPVYKKTPGLRWWFVASKATEHPNLRPGTRQ
jgi:hypothetical protein